MSPSHMKILPWSIAEWGALPKGQEQPGSGHPFVEAIKSISGEERSILRAFHKFCENVGVEINGKSEYFSRPVLVLKKLSRYGFMGIPITSQKHEGSWYVSFEFQNRTETAVLSQAKVFSISRLYSRIGQVPDTDLAKVREGFIYLYSK